MLKTKHKDIPGSKNIFTFPSGTRNTKIVLLKVMPMGTRSVAFGLYIRLVYFVLFSLGKMEISIQQAEE